MAPLDYLLSFTLGSDTVFGSASRSSTLVDLEIQYDQWGCPYLPGRTLKGVLREECANLLYGLSLNGLDGKWIEPAIRLFGLPGMHFEETILKISDAVLPDPIRHTIQHSVSNGFITWQEILHAMTTIRKQTAVDPFSGAARDKSLRSLRVILRKTTFESCLHFTDTPLEEDLGLLGACVRSLRRLGASRNRGMGELELAWLTSEKQPFQYFKDELMSVSGGSK